MLWIINETQARRLLTAQLSLILYNLAKPDITLAWLMKAVAQRDTSSCCTGTEIKAGTLRGGRTVQTEAAVL